MVSSDLWTDVDSKFGEIFMMTPEKAFAGLSVMTVSDLLQLHPVKGNLMFSQISEKNNIKHLLGLHLWHLFKYAGLNDAKMTKRPLVYRGLLKNVRNSNIDDGVEKLQEAIFIHECDENYSKEVFSIYAELQKERKLF